MSPYPALRKFRRDCSFVLSIVSIICSSFVVRERFAIWVKLLKRINAGVESFKKSDFDTLAVELKSKLSPHAWINPHKSFWGLGNYDANVLINAIQRKGKHIRLWTMPSSSCYSTGFQVDWYDRRKPVTPESVPVGNDDSIIGLICNRPTRSMMGLWKGHHWYGIRSITGDLALAMKI